MSDTDRYRLPLTGEQVQQRLENLDGATWGRLQASQIVGIDNYYTKTKTDELLDDKQDKLTSDESTVFIDSANNISALQYTAGTNITINNVASSTTAKVKAINAIPYKAGKQFLITKTQTDNNPVISFDKEIGAAINNGAIGSLSTNSAVSATWNGYFENSTPTVTYSQETVSGTGYQQNNTIIISDINSILDKIFIGTWSKYSDSSFVRPFYVTANLTSNLRVDLIGHFIDIDDSATYFGSLTRASTSTNEWTVYLAATGGVPMQEDHWYVSAISITNYQPIAAEFLPAWCQPLPGSAVNATYVLKAKKTSGTVSYTWVKE